MRITSNAATLWRWISAGDGDLVVTDVVMPDENAFDLLPRIKKARPDLPVLVMSAQNTFMTAIKASEKGAYDYLPKPFDLTELIAIIGRALSEPKHGEDRRGRQPARGADPPRLAARRRRRHRAARRSTSWCRSTRPAKDEIVTQWDKNVVESLGLLKMDFLGLRTLTVIDDTLKTLRSPGRSPLDLDEVPLDDPEVYRLFCDGRTNGIFQFESRGMKDLLRRAQPSKFEDLAAFNALYRPGALSVGMVEEFIQRKIGQKKVRYILPETEPILEETYGVIAYQEQVMQIAVADRRLHHGRGRRAAQGDGQEEARGDGRSRRRSSSPAASRKGYEREQGEELWNYIEPFAGYGFNKSHSVAYAMLAYKTAYLKAHYPRRLHGRDAHLRDRRPPTRSSSTSRECRTWGSRCCRRTSTRADWQFTVDGRAPIRFGLGAVKGVGEGGDRGDPRRRAGGVGRFRGARPPRQRGRHPRRQPQGVRVPGQGRRLRPARRSRAARCCERARRGARGGAAPPPRARGGTERACSRSPARSPEPP